ncbi:MAG: hypothetical protein PHQ00_05840 [Phycisphaerae bacterium]|nr:hypothetical protein [Phycisphaerae bacterium]
MCKLLIMDKSIFHGTNADKLYDFVRNHKVVLPYVLFAECVMSQPGQSKVSKDPHKLSEKYLKCIKEGAYAGKSPGKIFHLEKSNNVAIDSIIDEQGTAYIKTCVLNENGKEQSAKICEKDLKPMVDIVKDWVKGFYENIRKENKMNDFIGEANTSTLEERLKKRLRVANCARQAILKQYLSDLGNIDSDWWTWQILRLGIAWGIELGCKRCQSGPSIENRDISNDIYDIYYVSCLLKADGILTGDKDLVQPLTRTAFPEKDVYRNIDEVSSEYICNK